MFWILTTLALLGVIYLCTIKWFKYWGRRGVKQRFSLPPFGDTADMSIKGYSFCEMIMRIYNSFPDARYIGLYQFYSPALMLKDPELIKQLCVKDFEHFLDHRQHLPEDADPLWNKALFSLHGQKWKDMRNTLSPSFTGSKIRQMFVLMQKCVDNFVDYLLQDSEEIIELDLKDIFARYSNDIIATTAFGIQCDSLKDPNNDFFVKGRRTADFTGFWKNVKFILIIFIPWVGKFLDAAIFDNEVSTFFKKVMKETLEYREKNHVQRPDMINLLINAKNGIVNDDEVGRMEESSFAAVEEHLVTKSSQKRKMELSLEDITAQALIFYFAGFETISSIMGFMAYELALNPDIQQRLIEELDEFREENKEVTYEGLAKLSYLDMVVSETLRKWPTNLVTDRACNKPYTIKAEHPDEKPVDLTEADNIWVPIWALHHDPKYWENPEKFDPERFSPENKENIVPYTYLPFGVGPRNCIGSRFAIIEIKAVYFGILEHFQVVPIERSCIPFVPSKRAFNLAPANGFWFGLKKRKTTDL